MSSFEISIVITAKYLLKNNSIQSMQLIALVALMLASKIFDYSYFSLAELHQVSDHAFTKKDIRQMQAKILIELDFMLLTQGCLHKKLLIVLEMTKLMIPAQKIEKFYQVCKKVEILFWLKYYTIDLDRKLIEIFKNPNLIICTILKISLIILTKTNGNFPHIEWMRSLLKVKSQQLEIGVEKFSVWIFGPEIKQLISL